MLQWTDQENESREGKREQRSGMSHIAAAGKEPLASPTTEWTDRWTKLYWPLHANLWATASMLAQLSETPTNHFHNHAFAFGFS